MFTKPITFCGKDAHNITDDTFKATILELLKNSFPRLQFQTHMIHMFEKMPHLACLKSNGTPYYFLLTKIDHKNLAIFIEKKTQIGHMLPRMTVVPFQLHENLFDNPTLFDGEMTKDGVFLINDISEQFPLMTRLQRICTILETQFKPSIMDVCSFQVKRYVPLSQIEQHIGHGIIFKSMYGIGATIYMEKCYTKVPNKKIPANIPVATNMKNIQRGINVDTYLVYSGETLEGTLRVPSLKTSLQLQEMFKGLSAEKRLAMECVWDAKFDRFVLCQSCMIA